MKHMLASIYTLLVVLVYDKQRDLLDLTMICISFGLMVFGYLKKNEVKNVG